MSSRIMMLMLLALPLILAGCQRDAEDRAADSAERAEEALLEVGDLVESADAEVAATAELVAGTTDALVERARALAEDAQIAAREAATVAREQGGAAWEEAREVAERARERAEAAVSDLSHLVGETSTDVLGKLKMEMADVEAAWERLRAAEAASEQEPDPEA